MPNQYTHPMPIEERFWTHVERLQGDDTCWVWTARANDKGYGALGIGGRRGRQVRAHRLAFEFAYGQIPDGMMVLHTCDNPRCVRNDDEGWYEVNGILHPRRGHLWLGTAADNTADMLAKQRNYHVTHPERLARGAKNGTHTHPERLARGDRHGAHTHPECTLRGKDATSAKLTEDDVREIRRRFAGGGISQATLAREYKVHSSNIYCIIRRLTWRHVS